eukprot:Phypoly_transcript_02039.p1 GENE.Phypoly_transcript_02039~~Phypoly_transcript_02039.p1  ORF type:complete len:934 (+),score=230.55 Phypoly_transcript_02039:97-2898(+)
MSSPASAASLPQRLSAKEWNIRLAANEELIALLNDASETNVAEFSRYVPFLKKIVVDPYPPVKEKAMDALLIFMSKFNYQSVVPPNFGAELASILIDKCLSARDSIKTKTVEALLLLIENGSADVVVSELCRVATTHKVPKISSLCVFTLREAVMQFGFGPGCIPPDHILPILEPCFDHPFKDMRTEAFALTVEVYRWLGPALRQHIKGLRPTQQKELDVAFDMLPPDSRQSLVPVRTIKKTGTGAGAPASSPISVPAQGLASSSSSSSINTSPSVQASLAALKNNPKRRSLSIPKALAAHSPTQAPAAPSPAPSPHTPSLPHNASLSHIPSPSGTSPSQIPIRRSLTNIQLGTPSQSPTPSNRSSMSLTHEDIASLSDHYADYQADLSGDTGADSEEQNLPPVDILGGLNSDWYKSLTDSGGTWHTRKAQVDQLITLVPPGSPLKGNPNEYSKLVGCLTRLLADPNVSVQQSTLRVIEILAVGLRSDFSQHAKRIAPFLFEKFKDKKTTIVEIVHSLLDLFHQLQCFSIADVIEPILTTLSSKNPQMKYECLLWLERVIPTTSRQVLLQVGTPLCDSFVKLLDDSVVAVRNAASRAFVWFMETLGEQAAKPFADGLSRQHLSKLKEVGEINSFKKEPPRTPSTPAGKPTPRPAYTRSASSKSLLTTPKASPIRQSSELYDEGDSQAPSTNGDDSHLMENDTKEEEGRARRDSLGDSPFNESNSVYQGPNSPYSTPKKFSLEVSESAFLHTMKQEIASFHSKMNSTVESFERHLKDKDGRRKEEAQFIQEYDKELHSWNEDLQNKNKAILEDLEQEKKQRKELQARVAELEEIAKRAADSNHSNSANPANPADSSISDAEVQEKFALLEELETVTLEKDEAIAQLGLERAKFSEDSDWLSTFDDEELDRLEEEHQRTLEAIARAREMKMNGEG